MIILNEKSARSLYEQIYEKIKVDILDGTLLFGHRLPAIRELSHNLCVSRNTVEAAYRQLALEGYVTSRKGSRYRVADISLSRDFYYKITQEREKQPIVKISPPPINKAILPYNFQYGNLNPTLFPYGKWAALHDTVLSTANAHQICSYNDRQGEYALRTVIQQHLALQRGVCCDANQIIILNGLESALITISDLISTSISIGMEEPGYDTARNIFLRLHHSVFPLRIISENQYFDDLSQHPCRLLYLTPSHQFPTGHVATIHFRYQLLKWATKNDAYLIEDDYDSDLRYHTRPIPSLYSICRDDRVIYIGTFSKSFSPALRMNYMVLPKHFISIYHKENKGFLFPVHSWQNQMTLAEFIKTGDLQRHIQKVRTYYCHLHDTLLTSLYDVFKDTITVSGKNAGLHLLVNFSQYNLNQDALIKKAAAVGVGIYPTSPYYENLQLCPTSTVLLGFAALSPQQIRTGINLLSIFKI